MKAFDENTLMVHPLNLDELHDYVLDQWLADFPADSKLQMPHDAVIEVPGGYLLINTDCCYQLSQTELWAGHIVETLRLSARQNKVTPIEGGGTHTNPVVTFSFVLPGHDLRATSLCNAPVTLKNYQLNRGRHDYNPRIIKNKNELIKIVNQYYQKD